MEIGILGYQVTKQTKRTKQEDQVIRKSGDGYQGIR